MTVVIEKYKFPEANQDVETVAKFSVDEIDVGTANQAMLYVFQKVEDLRDDTQRDLFSVKVENKEIVVDGGDGTFKYQFRFSIKKE